MALDARIPLHRGHDALGAREIARAPSHFTIHQNAQAKYISVVASSCSYYSPWQTFAGALHQPTITRTRCYSLKAKSNYCCTMNAAERPSKLVRLATFFSARSDHARACPMKAAVGSKKILRLAFLSARNDHARACPMKAAQRLSKSFGSLHFFPRAVNTREFRPPDKNDGHNPFTAKEPCQQNKKQ